MEFFGKLTHKLDVQTIETKTGPKGKLTFVIMQPGQYGKSLAFETVTPGVITFMADTSIGTELKILGDATSREYQGKWYTSAYASSVEVCKSEGAKDVSYAQPSASGQAPATDPVTITSGNPAQDLPF